VRDAGIARAPAAQQGLSRIILASSLGTLFEWYDFYLYGTLAVFFGELFFPPGNERAALLASLATFGAGFGVRPLGALVFGRIGDRIGRKYTFLVTLLTMGVSTALIGVLPTYASVGMLAPVLLVLLRLIQGLALGGEYGGAATYVAEHVRDDRRGFYTSFIQTTATLGFFVSLGVIGAARLYFGADGFRAYGWRVPFLFSVVLLAVSLYIRLRMRESPLFAKLKSDGQVSRSPLRESFGNPRNLKFVLLALFGATAGQGVVWYTGQFYALTFLQKPLNLDWKLAYGLVACALALGTPLFLLFGWLSDRIGRKRIMLAGCALAAASYVPIYVAIQRVANPTLAPAVAELPLASMAILVGLLTLQMVYVAMVYGPIAAFLVELFPTSIRYTSMSLPYHLGNGWFGGFLPLIATATTTSAWAQQSFGAGAIFSGLWYPIAVCLLTVAVGGLMLHETKDHRIDTPIR
jgi:MFS family permease